MDGLFKQQAKDDEPISPHRRIPVRTAVLAGASVAAVIGVIWVMRLPIGAFILKQQLSTPDAPAALAMTRLDFGGMAIEDVRVGPAAAPDLTAKTLAVDFGWGAGGFKLAGIRLEQAQLRVRVDEKGVSFGAFDKWLNTAPRGPSRPPVIPDLTLVVRETAVETITPLGAFTTNIQASGALRRAFTAEAVIAPRDVQGERGGLEALEAHLSVRTANSAITARLTGSSSTIGWREGQQASEISGASFNIAAAAPVGLNNSRFEAKAGFDEANIANITWRGASLDSQGDTGAIGAGFIPQTWSATLRAALAAAKGDTIDAGNIIADATLRAENARLAGGYALTLGRGGAFGFSAPGAKLDGPLSGDFSRSPWTFTVQGDLAAPQASIDARTRRTITDAIPGLGGTPLEPLVSASKPALDRALSRFSLAAPLSFAWANGQGRLAASGAANLKAASGAQITVAPLSHAGPSFGIVVPSGAFDGGASIDIAGASLPQGKITVSRLQIDKDRLAVQGDAQISHWRARDAALQTQALAFDIKNEGSAGSATLKGDVKLTGPIAGLRLVDATTPLNIAARWKEGFRIEPANGVCQDIRTGRIEAAGLLFDNAALSLCPASGGAFAAADQAGNYSGGFYIGKTTLNGRMEGTPARPATLTLASVASNLGGGNAGMRLDTKVAEPALSIEWDATRRVNLRGKGLTANLLTTAQSWRVTGDLSDVSIEDNTAPARVESFNGKLIIEPKGDEAVLRVTDGAGRVFDWHDTKILQPLTLRNVTAALEGGKATANGAIRLEKPDAALGQFTLTHDLASGNGDAAVTARALTFSPLLQPYQISETVLGVVANVAGPIDADIGAHWRSETFTTDARFDLKTLNMATAALGPVEGVSGVINFSDFATLSTPPGQTIKVGQINPGIVVKDGVISFQMKPDLNVVLEAAIWPFAGGRLSVMPSTFDFNAKETRFTLDLADVDVNELIKQLNVKDLVATGKVEGRFPLIVTDGKARIEDGKLQAAPGGGTIQYNSDIKQGGVAQLAFDALRSFRYDDLRLALSGNLDDELVTAITFSGVNREPVSQSAGPAQIKLVGIPFKFNVTVRAPFVALSRTAASVTDARSLINPPSPEPSIDITATPQTPLPAKP